MSAAEILAKCGMSVDGVRKAASKCMVKVDERKLSVAEQNELKFADVELEEDRWAKQHTGVYSEIQSGADNGVCTTRRSTYRCVKTGDGRCATAGDLRIRREMDRTAKRRKDGQYAKKGE